MEAESAVAASAVRVQDQGLLAVLMGEVVIPHTHPDLVAYWGPRRDLRPWDCPLRTYSRNQVLRDRLVAWYLTGTT